MIGGGLYCLPLFLGDYMKKMKGKGKSGKGKKC